MNRVAPLLLLLLVWSCQPSSYDLSKRLSSIDELLYSAPSVALDSLQSLDGFDLKDEQAYYGLLLTIAQHKNSIPFESDSVIAASREWFASGKDYRNQARSTFYHGLVLSYLAPYDTMAHHYMQQARTIIEEKNVQDDRLSALLYAFLGKINNNNHNPETAVAYYTKAVAAEARLNNPRNLILDYCALVNNLLETDVNEAKQQLQALDSVIACHPEIRLTAPDNTKALFYLYGEENLDSAALYCHRWKAYGVDLGTKASLLATIYERKGKLDSALVYQRIAIDKKRPTDSLRYYVLYAKIANLFQQRGESDSAAVYALAAYNTLRDSYKANTEKRILELEKKYDLASRNAELEKARHHRNLLIILLSSVLLLSATLCYFLILRKQQFKAEQVRNSLIQAAAKTHQYTLSKLSELTDKPKSRTVESLQDQIKDITKNLRIGFSNNFTEAIEMNLDSFSPKIKESLSKLEGARAKTVYVLSEYGLSFEEIAEYTCTSVDSVRVTVNKNKKILQIES